MKTARGRGVLRPWPAATVLALQALLFTVSATTVIPPTFEEITDRAELIFVGKVASSKAERRTLGAKSVIFTMVEFEAQEMLKGGATNRVTLQFLGGTIGDVTLEVPGVPKFKAGERVVLFVEGNGVQFCPLVGVYHGKFGARKDETTGREVILMHDGEPLYAVEEIGAGEVAKLEPKRAKFQAEPLSLEAFKSKIHDHLHRRSAQTQSK